MNIQLWIFIIKEERSEVHFKIPFLRSFSTSPPLIPGSERMYLGWANVSQIYNNLLYILMFAMVLDLNHLSLTFEYIHIFCTICAVFANFSPYILNFNYIDEYAGVLSVNFAFCGLVGSTPLTPGSESMQFLWTSAFWSLHLQPVRYWKYLCWYRMSWWLSSPAGPSSACL